MGLSREGFLEKGVPAESRESQAGQEVGRADEETVLPSPLGRDGAGGSCLSFPWWLRGSRSTSAWTWCLCNPPAHQCGRCGPLL